VKDVAANSTIAFKVSSENGGIIEVRNGGSTGSLLGVCTILSTGSWNTYQTVSSALQNDAGTLDLCFVFKGVGADLMHLDWFCLTAAPCK